MDTETVSPTDWERLCQSQMQRALAGDAKAAQWVAQHKPIEATGAGGMPSIEYITRKMDLSKLSIEQLRALAGESPTPNLDGLTDEQLDAYIAKLQAADVSHVDRLVLRWKDCLCVPCREKMLARLEDETAPDAKDAKHRQGSV